jgi:hypothetical protein
MSPPNCPIMNDEVSKVIAPPPGAAGALTGTGTSIVYVFVGYNSPASKNLSLSSRLDFSVVNGIKSCNSVVGLFCKEYFFFVCLYTLIEFSI